MQRSKPKKKWNDMYALINYNKTNPLDYKTKQPFLFKHCRVVVVVINVQKTKKNKKERRKKERKKDRR